MNEEPSANTAVAGDVGGLRLPRTALRWLIVILLAGVCAALLSELLRGTPQASAQTTTAGRVGKYLAVAGQITAETYGLYILDLESGIITVYQWMPGSRSTGKLRLLAARNVTFDLQLDEYNTEPSPNEIKDLVRQGRRLGSTRSR